MGLVHVACKTEFVPGLLFSSSPPSLHVPKLISPNPPPSKLTSPGVERSCAERPCGHFIVGKGFLTMFKGKFKAASLMINYNIDEGFLAVYKIKCAAFQVWCIIGEGFLAIFRTKAIDLQLVCNIGLFQAQFASACLVNMASPLCRHREKDASMGNSYTSSVKESLPSSDSVRSLIPWVMSFAFGLFRDFGCLNVGNQSDYQLPRAFDTMLWQKELDCLLASESNSHLYHLICCTFPSQSFNGCYVVVLIAS